MADFPGDVVAWLRNSKEVTIRTAQHPDTGVIIWIVVAADGAVYVRSVKGDRGRWYRDLRADGNGTLLATDSRCRCGRSRRPMQQRWKRPARSLLRNTVAVPTLARCCATRCCRPRCAWNRGRNNYRWLHSGRTL